MQFKGGSQVEENDGYDGGDGTATGDNQRNDIN